MTARRILIVESDSQSAEELRRLVSDWGYEASLEPAALEPSGKLHELRPSVVIAGVGSQADGFGLLRQIRVEHPETPVILLTDRGSIEIAVQAVKEEGAYHYFEKPIDTNRL